MKLWLLFFLFFLVQEITVKAQVTEAELEAAIEELRSHGFILFPNAIQTSDLRLRILSTNVSSLSPSTCTIFAPPDLPLFRLDIHSTANQYVLSLLRHVSHHRLPLLDLLNAGSIQPCLLDSLVPDRPLLIQESRNFINRSFSMSLTVDSVSISDPDLFIGPSIVVHGLDGILHGGTKVGQVKSIHLCTQALLQDPSSLDNRPQHRNFAKYRYVSDL